MEIIGLQIFVTLFLVLGSLLLYVFSWKQRDFDHADRLALLPMEEDAMGSATAADGVNSLGQAVARLEQSKKTENRDR